MQIIKLLIHTGRHNSGRSCRPSRRVSQDPWRSAPQFHSRPTRASGTASGRCLFCYRSHLPLPESSFCFQNGANSCGSVSAPKHPALATWLQPPEPLANRAGTLGGTTYEEWKSGHKRIPPTSDSSGSPARARFESLHSQPAPVL